MLMNLSSSIYSFQKNKLILTATERLNRRFSCNRVPMTLFFKAPGQFFARQTIFRRAKAIGFSIIHFKYCQLQNVM